MKNLLNFLNSAAGLVILGFVVTTVGGGLITHFIQTGRSNNQRDFEMYKTRLEEAKTLQKVLLGTSTARVFYLEQILSKLGDEDQKLEDTKKFWQEKYSSIKDDWNKNLVYWHAQMKVLFPKGNLHNLLVSDDEDRIIIHDNPKKYLNEDEYNKHKPRTVHGAFVYAHATVYYMVFDKCPEKKDCKSDDFMKLAEKQMNHLKFLHGCLSYRISGELLVNPYGPQKEFVVPKECHL